MMVPSYKYIVAPDAVPARAMAAEALNLVNVLREMEPNSVNFGLCII